MKQKNLFLALACLLASLNQVPAQHTVSPAGSGQDVKPVQRICYCLPQNGIRLKITLEKTVQKRGIYSNYAEQMLKLPAIRNDKESYRILDVEFRTESFPDPQQTYSVAGNPVPALMLSPDGILRGVNLHEMEKTPGPAPRFRGPEAKGNQPPQDEPGQTRLDRSPGDKAGRPSSYAPAPNRANGYWQTGFAPVADLNVTRRFDTTTSYFQTDTALVIEKVLYPVMDERSTAEQARKMAEKVFQIQADQNDLLTGLQEVAYPAGTIRFMYKKLDETKQRILECFTGTWHTEILEYEIRILPQKGQETYYIGFFSPETGLELLEKEEQASSFESEEDLLVLRLHPLPSIGVPEKEPRPEKQETGPHAIRQEPGQPAPEGFHYRIPLKVEASLQYNGETLGRKDLPIAQWGQTGILPGKPCILRLDAKTGGLEFYQELPQPDPKAKKPKK